MEDIPSPSAGLSVEENDMTKLILFLHSLLSFEKQKALTLKLVSVCFPGSHVHKSPAKGVKKPRKYEVKGE
jgi:hypothetical protein